MKPTKLYKTTIEIWSEEDPFDQYYHCDDALVELASDASSGSSFCERMTTVEARDERYFPDTEFFGTPD